MTKELKLKIQIATIFILVSFILFGIALPYPFFVFDDSMHITSNNYVGDFSFTNIFYYWQNSKTPLIFNFWQIIAAVFGKESAMPFRFISIVLHGLNSFLVFIWLKKITTFCFKGKDQKNSSFIFLSSLFGAFFFLTHPIHTEVVVWVSAQKDALSFLTGILSFIFYIESNVSLEKKLKNSTWSFIFFLLSLLVKPSVLPLIFVYIWLDITLFSIQAKKILPRYFHYFLLGSIFALMHLNALQDLKSPISFLGKMLVAFDAIRLSIFNMLLPYDLRFDYQRTFNIIGYQFNNSFTYQLSIILVGIFIYISFITLYKKFWKPIHFSMGIFIILISINMGFIPFLFQNISTVADRYVYFPSIGFALFFSWLTWLSLNYYPKQKQALILPSLLIIIFAFLSFQHSKSWSNSSTLIKKSIESSYLNFATIVSLGVALDDEGHPREAIEYFKTALKISPKSPEAYEHLFKAYINAGLLEEAGRTLVEMNTNKIENSSTNLFIDVTDFYLKTGEVFKAEDTIRKIENLAKTETGTLLKDAALKLRALMERKKREKIYNALWLIGNMELENKNTQEGIKLLQEAYQVSPDGRFTPQIKLILHLK